MLQLLIEPSTGTNIPQRDGAGKSLTPTGYEIPADRTGWHRLTRLLYDYWLAIAPPGGLPGRQHLLPEAIAPLWSRASMLEVSRSPLRYRYRLCGTEIVRLLGREVTGEWLDEAHPAMSADPQSCDQLRSTVETGSPTWRRGPPLWSADPQSQMVETCIVPLAGDGCCVDRMLAVSVLCDGVGRLR